MYGEKLYVVVAVETFDAEADIYHKFVDSVWTDPRRAYTQRNTLRERPQTTATVLAFAPNVPGDTATDSDTAPRSADAPTS
jgi:uncharacterized damage-inducible protein DinB